jgi:hypothetical protein
VRPRDCSNRCSVLTIIHGMQTRIALRSLGLALNGKALIRSCGNARLVLAERAFCALQLQVVGASHSLRSFTANDKNPIPGMLAVFVRVIGTAHLPLVQQDVDWSFGRGVGAWM